MNLDFLEGVNNALAANLLLRSVATMALVGLASVFLRLVLIPVLHRLVGRTESDLDDDILKLLHPALAWTLVLFGGVLVVRDLTSGQDLDLLIQKVVLTLVALIWGRFLMRSGSLVFRHLGSLPDKALWIQSQNLPLVQFLFKVVVIFGMIYLIMSSWGIDLTTWLASAGVLGIAVGFAAKDTLANFISGVFILADAPYKVGDYIVIDGATRGLVTDIGMRSTRVLTRDNVEVTVPNAVIGNAKIINETSGPSTLMRVRVDVGVAYGSDVEQVREILMKCIEDVPHVSRAALPSVRFVKMGESSLLFQVRAYVDQPELRGRLIDTLNTRIYGALAEHGVKIPFPQRDLHIKSWPHPPGG